MATEYNISENGKTYTIKIRKDVNWHDGEPLTIDDIIFTFNAIKDPQYKSPLRFSFVGVNVKKVDEETISFVLSEPYAAFLELLTFGILPEHLWLQIPPEAANLAEMNIKPIGSGPYQFKSLVKDKKTGLIKSYHLTANKDYYQRTPYIKDFSFRFFINFEELIAALNNNSIDGIGYLPRAAKDQIISQDSIYFHNLSLPQLTAIFFNKENNKYLGEINIRKALAMAIDKNYIANEIFHKEVEPIYGPILPDNFAYNNELEKYDFDLGAARELLIKEGWATTTISELEVEIAEKILANNNEEIASSSEDNIIEDSEDSEEEINMSQDQAKEVLSMGTGTWFYKKDSSPKEYLIINLSTVDNEDNILVVNAIKNFWEKLGVKTNISIVDIDKIQAEVIKPRKFEALFYGQVVGSDPDSYVFWHSSQIGENGLNIANYANSKVDSLLEEARLITDQEQRTQKYKEFQKIITDDVAAIFMYSPLYTYIQSKEVKGFATKSIFRPSDRFSNIADWYIKTRKKISWKK